MTGPVDRPALARHLQAEVTRLTGKRYQISWDLLDTRSLYELKRFVNEIQFEQRVQVNRALRRMRVVG